METQETSFTSFLWTLYTQEPRHPAGLKGWRKCQGSWCGGTCLHRGMWNISHTSFLLRRSQVGLTWERWTKVPTCVCVCMCVRILQFSSVQSLSRVRLFATPWIAARQASLSITNSRSSLKLMCEGPELHSKNAGLRPHSVPTAAFQLLSFLHVVTMHIQAWVCYSSSLSSDH